MLILPYPAIDPVALEIGSIKIHWYGIAYVVGILLGWRFWIMLLSRLELPLARKDIDDFIPWATLGIVAGGRIGHALFYNLDYYIHKPWEVLYIWQPGMSFHGGLLGVILVARCFTAKRQIPRWTFGDILAAGTPIGLFFGRIANFINGELYGRAADTSWAMIFPNGGPIARHPSQLYEAFLEGIFLFALMAFLSLRLRWPEKRPGAQLGVFLTGYGLARIFVECFREPDGQIGYLLGGSTLGQWLSLPLVIIGLGIVYKCFQPQKVRI
jgi:phosphatidylglycerol:prolipoprotein diacylglycerol transferase